MALIMEDMFKIIHIIEKAVAESRDKNVERIFQRVRDPIDRIYEEKGMSSPHSVQHLKNLIRKTIAEQELSLHLGDPEEEKIRQELAHIQQEIEKSKPIFAVRQLPISKN